MIIINVKHPHIKYKTKKEYNDAAKTNQSKLLDTMENISIKEDTTPSPIVKIGKGFGAYKSRKPKTFSL